MKICDDFFSILSKCGKTEKLGEEFTNKDGSTICKECWLDEENNNQENN